MCGGGWPWCLADGFAEPLSPTLSSLLCLLGSKKDGSTCKEMGSHELCWAAQGKVLHGFHLQGKNTNRAGPERKNPQDGDVLTEIQGKHLCLSLWGRTWLVPRSRSTYTSAKVIAKVLLIHRNVSALLSPTKITGSWDGLCWKGPYRCHSNPLP